MLNSEFFRSIHTSGLWASVKDFFMARTYCHSFESSQISLAFEYPEKKSSSSSSKVIFFPDESPETYSVNDVILVGLQCFLCDLFQGETLLPMFMGRGDACRSFAIYDIT